MNFEKYSEFVMNFPILIHLKQNNQLYIWSKNILFSDFMNGKIKELKNQLPNENDLTIHLKYYLH